MSVVKHINHMAAEKMLYISTIELLKKYVELLLLKTVHSAASKFVLISVYVCTYF